MPTPEQLKAGQSVVFAVAEAIRELGEAPSGTLYAVLCGRVSYQGYEKIIGMLKRADLVSESPAHLLTWIGPKLGEMRSL